MNLQGYTSDSSSNGESQIIKIHHSTTSAESIDSSADTHRDSQLHFASILSATKTTYGGTLQATIPLTKFVRKASFKANKKNKRRKTAGPESASFSGPWEASSSSEDSFSDQNSDSSRESEDRSNSSPNGHTQRHNDLSHTTELYTKKTFMETSEIPDVQTNKSSIPKTVAHTLTGHSRGVNRLRFIPKYPRLLLSCGNDGKIFLWDIFGEPFKVRGYFGHTQAVKDVVVNSNGEQFLSCSYDNSLILWKTETGEVLKRIELEATPNCAIFNPNNENEVIVGLANRKIEHYDFASINGLVQTYDHHLGAINSLTVLQSGTAFMSTSDDRTVRFWDWHVNIPKKIIADPTQHSIPSVAVHPSDNFIALQSMDNTIYVIQGSGKFRFNKKKSFEGHSVAGYGIDIDFSSNGSILMSGDVNGSVLFWQWRNGNLVRRLNVGKGVISSVRSHPSVPNLIAAAGRSGEIYICK